MKNYRLRTVILIVWLCLASGLVLAHESEWGHDPSAVECAEGEATPCAELISEPYVLAANEGEAIWFTDALDTIKASGAQTGGRLSVVEVLHPAGSATPLHIHITDDEALYILEGTMRGVMGNEWFTATAGSFVWFPHGIPHGYAADGDEPLRVLVIATASGFDRFVAEAGDPAQELTVPPPAEPDFERLAAAAEKYGIEILGPLELEP
jgi:quercetin dioxygenase-like cupin family protein